MKALLSLFHEKFTYLNIGTIFISFSNFEIGIKIFFYLLSIITSIVVIRKTLAETRKINSEIESNELDLKEKKSKK